MMASRFTKVFQLIALVLTLSVLNVYVMAGPINSGSEPGTTATSSAVQPTADLKVATPTASSESQLLTPEAAAEKISLRFGSKTTLNRVFSKQGVEARIAAGNSFLKADTSAAATFKTSTMRTSAAQDTGTSDDSDDNGKRSTWIAVGIIAAVLAITVIGLRHDRNGN